MVENRKAQKTLGVKSKQEIKAAKKKKKSKEYLAKYVQTDMKKFFKCIRSRNTAGASGTTLFTKVLKAGWDGKDTTEKLCFDLTCRKCHEDSCTWHILCVR